MFRYSFSFLFDIICSGEKYMNYSEIKQAVKMLSIEWNLEKKKYQWIKLEKLEKAFIHKTVVIKS